MLISLTILYAMKKSRMGIVLRRRPAGRLSRRASASIPAAQGARLNGRLPSPGVLGAFYSHYISVVNPDAFASLFTIYILIYMTVGGEKGASAHFGATMLAI